ncbi:MAG: hypothetical protein ACYDA0_05715 [Candidatus Dormibacteraceae bacterium]
MDYGQPVRLGVFTPAAAQPRHALAVAALADELGFDVIDGAGPSMAFLT